MGVDKLPATLRSREHFISWDDLQERLKARAVYDHWHPDECRFWEDIVDLKEVHSGGDPLVDIFDFIAKWDLHIFREYFGPSWRRAAVYFHANAEEVEMAQHMSTIAMKKYQLR